MKLISFPDWAQFTPERIRERLPQLLDESEKRVSALEASEAKTYADLVCRLDDSTRALFRCWGGVSHMTSVMNSEAWRKVEADFQPQIVMFSLRVGQSKKLYAATRRVLERDAALTPTRRRILEKMIQSAELAGVGLDGEKLARFNEIQQRLAKLSTDFSNCVIDATKAFAFEKDGKTYTIDDANYPETMKHCADREVREKLFRARAVRAPENASRIDEILKLRQEEAEILGYPDYAAKSLATKCAPSREAVFNMIDELDAATKTIAEREESELRSSASRLPACEGAPADDTLEPWDRAFEAERLRERKYAYSEDELKKYFELEDVLAGLFRLTHLLFAVEVVELKGDEKPSVWHPDVRFFAVREKGETIAHFYFDPYVRNGQKSGGAWMNELRNRRKLQPLQPTNGESVPDAELPLALICTNFPLPDEKGKTLLPFREVETLFHEFGHSLQHMLTRVDDEDAAGISLVEWDAVEVASQFMENWCLDDRTGIVVPDELKAKVRAAKNFRAATACRRQLAFAKLDLQLHVRETAASGRSPAALKTEMFAHFGLPTVPEDIFLCAFTHIFAGGYAAGYYGYKWAEVMSADCYGAFEEAGLDDDEKVRSIGRAYRETVLALGGSLSALDVFRKFRGRDPQIDALLRQQDLSESPRLGAAPSADAQHRLGADPRADASNGNRR